jgi:hypothetical protein
LFNIGGTPQPHPDPLVPAIYFFKEQYGQTWANLPPMPNLALMYINNDKSA